MILTAAAKDRTSFGCQSESDNTYFIKELLHQPDLLNKSMRETMAQAKLGVAALEEAQKLKSPSMPQQFYGSGAQDWSRQKLSQWFVRP